MGIKIQYPASRTPPYITHANWDPMKLIGYGLSLEDAEKIRDYKSELELK